MGCGKIIQKTIIEWISRLEDIIVYFLLSAILIFAVLQIIFRNFFDSGFVWGDSLLRILVLWLGLAGAILASRNDKQISIDVLYPYVPDNYKKTVQKINHFFAAAICLIISYYSLLFVNLEYQDSTMAFESVPAWLTESVIPVGFALMGIKYIAKLFKKSKI
ncbi:MAG: TRAP transporter small permease [endosymbiont of Galathealinum brachiosum]|uniref:TRAP transporter small permease protein n=1 Tax=endosymbiont of Galathealinum brachiosum TaxID=2200906 RepID=A0A370DCM5_9GAMM|nr:MAG: TRAP transporter small permease [endosymbiont of Galathealinum brachiosum]